LHYRISETESVLVISLVGDLTRANQGAVREIIRKVRSTQAPAVVLNLHDVYDIERAQLGDFAKLQAAVRLKRAQLRVCSIKPTLESFLAEMGLLRAEEVHQDLKSALVSLIL
jgi:anti-anti-sigma factor